MVAKEDSSGAYFCDQAEFHRGSSSVGTNIVELANEGLDDHRASCEAHDGAHWGGEGGEIYSDRMGGEVIATGACSVQG